jgi:hypothetical protein
MGQFEVIEFLKQNPGWHDAKEIVSHLDVAAPTNVLKSLERIRKYPVNVKLRQVTKIGSRRKGCLVWIYKFERERHTKPLSTAKEMVEPQVKPSLMCIGGE